MSSFANKPSHTRPTTAAGGNSAGANRRAVFCPFGRRRIQRAMGELGQAALVLVIAITVALTTVGAVMVNNISNNDPVITQASIQRYAYRALASGLNAYTSAINANPYLAACNANTNEPNGPDKSPQCSGLSYETWSQVPFTNLGNGVVPEWYKFDNPQEVVNGTTNALQYLEVQVVGAAGYNSNIVYYSTVAKYVPANGFLDNVWWTNFESSGDPTQCQYYWATGWTGNGNPCSEVNFIGADSIVGPIFSNDSIYVAGAANFGNYPVTTADPKCQFVDVVNGNGDDSPPGCKNTASDDGVTYNPSGSSFSAKNFETIPTDNTELGNYAKQGGCYYEGPTTVVLNSNGTMNVTSQDSPSNGTDTTGLNFGSDTSICPVNGSQAALPVNGVLFVDGGGNDVKYSNPLDGHNKNCNGQNPCNQTTQGTNSCNGCYYGQTSTPDTEGDAFVSGSLSGHLTIGANNDVVVQGPITYADCTFTGTPPTCSYNNASTGINDSLGLIAYNYVEVSRPVDNNGNVLANCGTGGALAAPLCNPSTSGGGGLSIDASILGLQQSFIVNNYQDGGPEGQLNVYGSIQQNARGFVGQFGRNGNITNGYGKTYTWDPRLAVYSPPYYLTPGTASWNLDSSSESYTGTCPEEPPVQNFPVSTQPTWPWPTNTGSACSGNP
jgi:hypothetical protein